MHRSRPSAVLSPAVSDPAARVGDADREATVALLSDAAAAGYLDPDELDSRLGRALSARTGTDLTALQADLPSAWLAQRRRRAAAEVARRLAQQSLPRHVASYVGVMVLLLAIWLVVGVTVGAWYPWPIWPALGWGISVAGHVRAARTLA